MNRFSHTRTGSKQEGRLAFGSCVGSWSRVAYRFGFISLVIATLITTSNGQDASNPPLKHVGFLKSAVLQPAVALIQGTKVKVLDITEPWRHRLMGRAHQETPHSSNTSKAHEVTEKRAGSSDDESESALKHFTEDYCKEGELDSVKVGSSVIIFSKEDEAFYSATVEKIRDEEKPRFYVKWDYPDFGKEWFDLDTNLFSLVGEEKVMLNTKSKPTTMKK